MKSQKFCCELNVRYESMIDDLQDRVKDLKQKQKDAYLLELDLRGKIIDLEKALANKRSAWTEQGLHLANAQKERDHYKERAILLRDELERVADLFDHNNNLVSHLDRLLEVEAAARNLIVCGQYSTSAFEKLERLVK